LQDIINIDSLQDIINIDSLQDIINIDSLQDMINIDSLQALRSQQRQNHFHVRPTISLFPHSQDRIL
jgi:hypothetical protein